MVSEKTRGGNTSKDTGISNWFGPTRRILINLLLLTVGSAIYSIGLNGILIPHGFLSGGLVGVTLTFLYLFPFLSFGLLYALLNVPLFWLSWRNISRKFTIYTAFGIIVFSLMAELLKVQAFPIENPILAAILAGIVCGFGSGLILRSAGSAGGMDILMVYLNKKFELRPGMTSTVMNAIILLAGAFLFSLEMALYTLIFVFTQGKVIDAVITGFNQRKSIIIISEKSQEIAQGILNELQRGVTFLEGTGGYTGVRKRVIFSIVTLPELARLKEMIFDLDPQAFIVVNDTLEVLGIRHGQRRIY